MDARQFDRIAKILGSEADRRRVLGALAGSVAAVLGKQQLTPAQADSDCAHFCEEVFPPGQERGQCVRDAAHGGGTCQECAGDVANFCGGACVDLTSDLNHCGRCDHACAATETCFRGSCCAPATASEVCTPCNCAVKDDSCGGVVDCGAVFCASIGAPPYCIGTDTAFSVCCPTPDPQGGDVCVGTVNCPA